MTSKIFFFLLFLSPFFILAQNAPSPFIGTNISRGNNLRVLRLAVSVTGEYTQSVAGATDADKVNEVLRLMKVWVAEMNIIFGREYCVRFELIPDNLMRTIIFTNAATDPYPDMTGGSGCNNSKNILDIQAATIDMLVGQANYDISHVMLHNFNGGCAGSFKRGYSVGFDLPTSRHEMGHQFSQAHVVNNTTAINYEPENAGRSIMGGNNDPYAHSNSYHQLAKYLINSVPNVGTNVVTGNNIPVVNAGLDKSIPISTPFKLTATAADADAGDILTYVWDQLDGAVPQSLPVANDIQGALFSRLLPQKSPFRTFPQISSVIANNFSNTEEDMPTQARDLNFRLTVNDNHQYNYNGTMVNASGINSDDIKIKVVDNGGAFQVTSQNMAVAYAGGSNQTINWNVVGTNLAPINTLNVKISLSIDGGNTFPFVLLNNTPNDGTESVTMPNIGTTNLARIKVEAVDNYFFAINTQNFTITENVNIAGINVAITGSNTVVGEYGQTDTYTIKLIKNPTGVVAITLTADNQTEISLDGAGFFNSKVISLNNTVPVTITVRGKYDTVPEGGHLGIIQHVVSASADVANYPVGMIGLPIIVDVSDAQIQPIIGVDFDNVASVDSPTNWVKITDIRNRVVQNIPYEDGTPSSINLTTTATNCGGSCASGSGLISTPPLHYQSLLKIRGAVYARGAASLTWSGLQPNTQYRIFIFALGIFGSIDQNISITGSGVPITFVQNTAVNILCVNDLPSSSDNLDTFGKTVTSTPTGTIVINVTSNLASTEMSFAGIGIRKILCPNSDVTLNATPIPAGISQTGFKLQATGTVQAGTNVSFLSGKAIDLSGVFTAQKGSIFEAQIGGCR